MAKLRPLVGFKETKFKKSKETGVLFRVRGGAFKDVSEDCVTIKWSKVKWYQDAPPKDDGEHLTLSLTHDAAPKDGEEIDDPISGQVTITISNPDNYAEIVYTATNSLVFVD